MNRTLKCIFCIYVGAAIITGFFVPSVRADDGALGSFGTSAASSAWTQLKNVLPTKPCAIVALCVAGGMVAKFLWTRYVTLRNLDEQINSKNVLYIDQRSHPIYNWMMGAPGFTTPVQIRSNCEQVKQALIRASLSGDVDIFQYATGMPLAAGHHMYWADVMNSIDTEIARIIRWMRSLEPLVGLDFKRIHLFGIRKNFDLACDSVGIRGFDRHAVSANQEAQIGSLMSEERGLCERTIAFLMANPNYDKAHRIFWELDQRLGRLRAIKDAIVNTPINWHVPLH